MASGNELIDDERDAIMIGVARSESFREIGLRLGRHHSVISREVRRNGGREDYRACCGGTSRGDAHAAQGTEVGEEHALA